MSKYSFYNYVFQNGSTAVLYNAATDGIIALQHDLAMLIKDNREQIDRLQMLHPDLYQTMIDKGMVVSDEADEAEGVIEQWRRADTDPTVFYLTVLPTLNCNLRCWYCYEEHKATANMTEETLQKVLRFLEKEIRKSELERFYLDFFGGEPLLPFKKTVWPILERAADLCQAHDVQLFVNFTTNGVLLTDEVRQALISLKLARKPGFQITIDGNREKHNQSRCGVNRQPTFDVIVKNIKDTLRAGMPVNNRFNYTADTVDTFVDVLSEYKDLGPDELALLHFDFQQVWQESHRKDVRQRALQIAEQYFERKQQVRIEKRYNRERCRDDAEDQASINYDGSVFKCTARDLSASCREGVLTDDGSIEWNERYERRMAVKYGNAACRACKVFPICHGGCSQSKLDAGDREDCIFGMTEEQRNEIASGRLMYILKTRSVHY